MPELIIIWLKKNGNERTNLEACVNSPQTQMNLLIPSIYGVIYIHLIISSFNYI